MGSWNKTCGLSNLPIKSGEEVYVFVLEKSNFSDRCYNTSFWKPTILPFLSEYNDYGGGENSHHHINYILDGLKNHIVELELGENEYHDIEIKRDKLDEELFFNGVHENRLFINTKHYTSNGYQDKQVEIDFVMFRKDIVDYILKENVFDFWFSETINGEYTSKNIECKFTVLLKNIPLFIDSFKQNLNKYSEMYDIFDDFPNYFPMKIESDNDYVKIIQQLLNSTKNIGNCSIINWLSILRNLIVNNEVDNAIEFIEGVLKFVCINIFMNNTRKLWIPACFEGSQSQEYDSYLLLNNAILNVINSIDDK